MPKNSSKMWSLSILPAILFAVIICINGQNSLAETNPNTLNYSIKPGDTLYSLSLRFNTSVENIVRLNPKIQPENLPVHTKIHISASPNLIIHNIVYGESLWKIAQNYGVRIRDIVAKNRIINPDIIYAGDILAIPRTQTVTLYFLKDIGSRFYLVPELRSVSAEGNIYKNTMAALIEGPFKDKEAYFPVPPSVTVHDVVVKNGIAYPDFSEEIYNVNVGSEGELLTLDAITNTLTEFKEIRAVYPLVNGSPMGSLAEHTLIEAPLTRNESVILR